MEIIYNNVLYNTRTQNELEAVLAANFINVAQEHFNQCVLWYQSFISGLVQMLDNHKLRLAVLIRDTVTSCGGILADVEFMLYQKDDKCYAYIHNLSIVSRPADFPLIAK